MESVGHFDDQLADAFITDFERGLFGMFGPAPDIPDEVVENRPAGREEDTNVFEHGKSIPPPAGLWGSIPFEEGFIFLLDISRI